MNFVKQIFLPCVFFLPTNSFALVKYTTNIKNSSNQPVYIKSIERKCWSIQDFGDETKLIIKPGETKTYKSEDENSFFSSCFGTEHYLSFRFGHNNTDAPFIDPDGEGFPIPSNARIQYFQNEDSLGRASGGKIIAESYARQTITYTINIEPTVNIDLKAQYVYSMNVTR